jgi:hypothetical protein
MHSHILKANFSRGQTISSSNTKHLMLVNHLCELTNICPFTQGELNTDTVKHMKLITAVKTFKHNDKLHTCFSNFACVLFSICLVYFSTLKMEAVPLKHQ